MNRYVLCDVTAEYVQFNVAAIMYDIYYVAADEIYLTNVAVNKQQQFCMMTMLLSKVFRMLLIIETVK